MKPQAVQSFKRVSSLELQQVPCNGLQLSHKYCVGVLVLSNQVYLISTDDLLQGNESKVIATGIIAQQVTCSETKLAAAFNGVVSIFNFSDLKQPMGTMNAMAPIRCMSFNPTDSNMLAVLTDQGNLLLGNHTAQGQQNFALPDTKITAMCFSPKGKQLCVGHSDGSMSQLKLDLTFAKRIPAYAGIPLSIFWISTTQFLVSFLINGDQLELVQIDVQKAPLAPLHHILGDPFVSESVNSASQTFMSMLHPNVIICSAATSSDVVVLSRTGDKWELELGEDDRKADLPLDHYSIGQAFYFNMMEPVIVDGSTYSPMPIYVIASQSGVVRCFSVINAQGKGENQKFASDLTPLSTASLSAVSAQQQPLISAPPPITLPTMPVPAFSFDFKPKQSQVTASEQSTLPSTSIPSVTFALQSFPILSTPTKPREDAVKQVSEAKKNLKADMDKEDNIALRRHEISPTVVAQFQEFQHRYTRFQGVRAASITKLGKDLAALQESFETSAKDVSKTESFIQDLEKTCAVQQKEIQTLRDKAVSDLAQMEYVNGIEEQNKDPAYLQLLRSRPLDSSTLKILKSIERNYKAIQHQIQECRKNYYYQSLTVTKEVSVPMKMSQIEQTLEYHAKAIQLLINKTNIIREKLGMAGPLEKLTQTLKTTSISEELKPVVSTAKLHVMREFLRKRNVVRVKPIRNEAGLKSGITRGEKTVSGLISDETSRLISSSAAAVEAGLSINSTKDFEAFNTSTPITQKPKLKSKIPDTPILSTQITPPLTSIFASTSLPTVTAARTPTSGQTFEPTGFGNTSLTKIQDSGKSTSSTVEMPSFIGFGTPTTTDKALISDLEKPATGTTNIVGIGSFVSESGATRTQPIFGSNKTSTPFGFGGTTVTGPLFTSFGVATSASGINLSFGNLSTASTTKHVVTSSQTSSAATTFGKEPSTIGKPKNDLATSTGDFSFGSMMTKATSAQDLAKSTSSPTSTSISFGKAVTITPVTTSTNSLLISSGFGIPSATATPVATLPLALPLAFGKGPATAPVQTTSFPTPDTRKESLSISNLTTPVISISGKISDTTATITPSTLTITTPPASTEPSSDLDKTKVTSRSGIMPTVESATLAPATAATTELTTPKTSTPQEVTPSPTPLITSLGTPTANALDTKPSVFGGTGSAFSFSSSAPTTTTTPLFGSVPSTSTFNVAVTASTPVFGGMSVTPTASPAVTTAPTFGLTTTATAFGNTVGFGTSSALAPTTTAASVTSTTASIFGASVTSPSTTFASAFGNTITTPVFGSPSTTAPIFGTVGTASPASTSVFGTGGTVTTAESVSTFATPTAAPVFGGATTTPSLFGGTTNTTAFGSPVSTTGSIFGGVPSNTPSVFSTNNATSVFGPSTTASAFGSTTTPSFTSGFGSSSTFGSSGGFLSGLGSSAPTGGDVKNVFGGGATFGQSTTSASNIFGGSGAIVTSAPSASFSFAPKPAGGTAFGSTTNTPSIFGGTSTFGTTTASAPSAFGGSPVFGSGPLSSFTSSGTASNTGSIFGGGGQTAVGFGQLAQQNTTTTGFGGGSVFGGSSTFGSPTGTSNASGSIFGGSSQFGQNTSANTFAAGGDGTNVFGGTPGFGSQSVFGGTQSPQQSSPFGGVGTTGGGIFGGTSTFGSPSTFGQTSPAQGAGIFGGGSTSAFGGGSGFGGNTGFGAFSGQTQAQQPTQTAPSSFGGTSFSSWR